MHNTPLIPRHWLGRRAPAASPQTPASPVNQLHDEIDTLFDSMFRGWMNPWSSLDFAPRFSRAQADGMLMPRLDVVSSEKEYAVSAELPGVKPEDVSVEIRENALVLRGEKKQERDEEKDNFYLSERSYGSFERVLALPDDADVDGITASNKDGVLQISIPRRAPEKPQARTIEVKSSPE